MSTQGSNVAIITVTEREQSINIFLCGQTFSNVVTDVGIPYIVRGDSIKKGAVVIDMGTNQVKVTTQKFLLQYFKVSFGF